MPGACPWRHACQDSQPGRSAVRARGLRQHGAKARDPQESSTARLLGQSALSRRGCRPLRQPYSRRALRHRREDPINSIATKGASPIFMAAARGFRAGCGRSSGAARPPWNWSCIPWMVTRVIRETWSRRAGTICCQDYRVRLSLTAVTDRTTLVNLAGHAYFNLEQGRSILDHRLQIEAAHYTPVDDDLLPDGRILAVAGTCFDFRKPVTIGALRHLSPIGYDHNFVVSDAARESPSRVTTLVAPSGGSGHGTLDDRARTAVLRRTEAHGKRL